MKVNSLRVKYFLLNPQERAEVFLSKAVPKRDDALAYALKPNTLIDDYRMKLAESRMIVFGALWLSKLCILQGVKIGFQLSEDAIEGDEQAASAIADECKAVEGNMAAALALALREFDEEQGGWLKGVATIMDCRDQWERALERGRILSDSKIDPKFGNHLAQCRHVVRYHWGSLKVANMKCKNRNVD